MEVPSRIGYHEVVDLRESFPISWKYSFRKNIGWLVFFCCVISGYLAVSLSPYLPDDISGALWTLQPYVLKVVGAIVLFKLILAELYRLTLYYGTEGFRLVVSRGIILKQRGSLPLLPITEIYIQRSWLDLLCGLCNINVYTPMDQTRQFARIECLSPAVAEDLQHFLNDILTTQVFLAPQAVQLEVEEENSHDQSGVATPAQPHAAHDKAVAQVGHDTGSKAFHGEVTDAA